ncbi:MAG: mannitol dehydrogenase [Rhodobacterales bacterium 32-66-7]|nr:MAG: mannitol dehydrogenase [Rhodobacterales bacterium 32-66-7]
MTLQRPAYDRSKLTPGIVHIGLGNFHRAHMAVYLDDLFGMGLCHDWAILGAGVREGDARMREALLAQGCLSTVIELDPRGRSARRVGSMIDFLPVEPDNAPLIAAMADPRIRIVSLTVTEGGYFINPATGAFDPASPEILADAADPHRTAFGAIIAALTLRRAAGVAPFTVMSCDNLPGNGDVTRNAVAGLAALGDPALAAWIIANVAFPNGMVDRITPATGPRERQMAAEFGLADDPVPVTCEPFRQWVLEDTFPSGRPDFEKVGVTLTPHVHSYEKMKIRILNGGHATIAYPGSLMDIDYVHEAMANPLIRGFLDKVERDEIIPYIPPIPGTDLDDYYRLIVERFSNPEVADRSNRQPKFIVPSIRDALLAGGSVEGLALVSALWCRYCHGQTDSGTEIAPNDPDWTALVARSKAARHRPEAWLEMTSVYGDIGQNAVFATAFRRHLGRLWAVGTQQTLQEFVGQEFVGHAQAD